MTEKSLEIPAGDAGLKIHGVLRGEYSQPLAILAPGLGGWMHDALLFNASRYFDQNGIASLRVSFYGDNDNQRNINDYDVFNAAEDINSIVEYVKNEGADWVAVIGHSYSGMAIVYSEKQQFDGAILWDPSHTDANRTFQAQINLQYDFRLVKDLGAYVSAHGYGCVISRKIFENNSSDSVEKSRKFKVPTLIINAGNSKEMQEYGKKYADSIDAPADQIVIQDCSHSFTEDGAMEKLFKLTTEWIKKHSSES